MIYLFIGFIIIAAPFIWMEIAERRIQNGKKKNERMEGKGVKGTAIFSR
ncbi:hypothetical protein B4092_3891 [Bacillus licheniformis]|nr:hypothetical protein [Bacillus licheniformis]KYC67976.1 hypothetical protein B4092_3891 [Bacillus licheniformis]